MSYEAWGEPDDHPFEAAIEAGWIDPTDVSKAMIDVMSERDRQQDEEGWKPEHDDTQTRGELALAGAAYAAASTMPQHVRDFCRGKTSRMWPPIVSNLWCHWPAEGFKPKDRRRDLVRAAALLIAEIERLDRSAALAEPHP